MDYIIKALLFIPFMTIVYFFIDYFKNILVDSTNSIAASSLFCQFGVWDGLSIFFTIIISAFAARQAIDFVK